MSHEDKDYIHLLRSRGYRVTPQRLIVLDAVCDYKGHATLPQIHSRVNEFDPTIDLSTIYRSLNVLREVGLVVESEIEGVGKVYRVSGESDHHHLVCITCGAILNISPDAIDQLAAILNDEYEFDLQADHLVLNGYCKSCRGSSS